MAGGEHRHRHGQRGSARDDDETHAGHDHAGHADIFRKRFWLTLVLALPVIVFSETVQGWFGYSMPEALTDVVPPVLGTVIFVYGGRVFLEGGWSEIRARQPGMMLLISMAIVVAFVASWATSLGFFDLEFWWELAALIVVMLLGHWQEMKAIGQARSALDTLAALLPDTAERETEGGIETVPIAELRLGDVVLVRPGGRVPADGEVIEAPAELDESTLTGESRSVVRSPGERVTGGTVAVASSLRFRVDAVGDDTALAGIQRLVEEAQASGSRTQALADRAAGLLFVVAASVGVLTFLAWWIGADDPTQAVVRTVTVLVVACPHALGLAIPLVIALSTALAAQQGILVRDRLALERMRQVDVVMFDKTGTLTTGDHRVVDVAAVDGDDVARIVALAGAVESDSEHPLARAILAYAERSGPVPRGYGFRPMIGRGVEATVDGLRVAVGGPALLREAGVEIPAPLREWAEPWTARGAAVLSVVLDGRVAGAIALEDRVREESRRAVDQLHKRGVRVGMITGDARSVAEAVAEDIGVDEVRAEVLPDQKDEVIQRLIDARQVVAMVGDGVNDAPALARADIGLAIGAGTDVAIDSAGIVLASDDPRAVVSAIRLSVASYRKMVQNLAWAVGYNAVAIPVAAGVLAPVGIVLPPAVGALLMSVSTVVVAINAQLLRRLDLRPESV